jgi:hypothetical protein
VYVPIRRADSILAMKVTPMLLQTAQPGEEQPKSRGGDRARDHADRRHITGDGTRAFRLLLDTALSLWHPLEERANPSAHERSGPHARPPHAPHEWILTATIAGRQHFAAPMCTCRYLRRRRRAKLRPFSVDLIAFYMLLFLFCGAIAWYFSGFRFIQRLDDCLFSLLRRLRSVLMSPARRSRV